MENVNLLAVWYLAIFGAFVPYLSWKSDQRIRAGVALPPRSKRVRNIVVMELIFLLVAVFAAQKSEIPLLGRGRITAAAVWVALGIVGISLAVLPVLWRLTSPERRKRMALTRPRGPRDLWGWLAVSLAAGCVEEIVYRGVMHAFVLQITGARLGWGGRNWWAAAGVCAVLFALAHSQQGLLRAIWVGLIGLGLHLLVWLTGALYLAMAAHFVYDFLAGVLYVRYNREVAPESTVGAPAPAA